MWGGIVPNCYESLIRIAVPLFFMFSGFLLFQPGWNYYSVKRHAFKILKLYLIWNVIYLPITIYFYLGIELPIFKIVYQYFYKLILVGENTYSFQLWYLLSSFYSYIALIVLKKLKIKNIYILMISSFIFIGAYIITGSLYEGKEEYLLVFLYLSRNVLW